MSTTTQELPPSLVHDYDDLICSSPAIICAGLPDCVGRLTAEHLPELICACMADIAHLEEMLNSDDCAEPEHDPDPGATSYLKGCLQGTRRLLAWAQRQQQEVAA